MTIESINSVINNSHLTNEEANVTLAIMKALQGKDVYTAERVLEVVKKCLPLAVI